MLRAICSAMVVLPAPWAPPINISSPGRRPPPIVLSSGTKPVAMGMNSLTLPEAIRSFRLVRTSRAERGASVPSPASSFQSAAGAVSASGSSIMGVGSSIACVIVLRSCSVPARNGGEIRSHLLRPK